MNSGNSPQDQNNLIFAVILSLVVLMAWQYFFAAPAVRDEKTRQEFARDVEAQRSGAQNQGPPGVATPASPVATQPATTPQPGQPTGAPVAREDALKASPRVAIKRANARSAKSTPTTMAPACAAQTERRPLPHPASSTIWPGLTTSCMIRRSASALGVRRNKA